MTTLITIAWLAAIGLDQHFRGWAKIEGSTKGFIPEYVLGKIGAEALELAETLVAEGRWTRTDHGFVIVGFDPDPFVAQAPEVTVSEPVKDEDVLAEYEEELAPEKPVQERIEVLPPVQHSERVLSVLEQTEARIAADRLAAVTEDKNLTDDEEEYLWEQEAAAKRLAEKPKTTVVVEDEDYDNEDDEDPAEDGFEMFQKYYPGDVKDSDRMFNLFVRRTDRYFGGHFEAMLSVTRAYADRVEAGDADAEDAFSWLSGKWFRDEPSFDSVSAVATRKR